MVGLHSRIIGLVGLHFRRVGLATRIVGLQSRGVSIAIFGNFWQPLFRKF